MALDHRFRRIAWSGFAAGIAVWAALPFAQTQPPAGQGLPSERPAQFKAVTDIFDYARREAMIPMRDGVKLHTVILVPKGASTGADPADAHAVRRQWPDDACAQRAPGTDSSGLRQRGGRDRRRRIHPRRARRARQVRVGRGLRDESAAARAAESDQRRSRHRHLRHDRLAGEARPRDERQGRHSRHLLRRLPAADGAVSSAPGAEGVGADEPDGGRLDGRRLVPQRRVPPAEHALHLRADRHARQLGELVARARRRLRRVHDGGIGGRPGDAARPGADRLLEQDPRASGLRRVLAASRRWTSCSRRSRSPFR